MRDLFHEQVGKRAGKPESEGNCISAGVRHQPPPPGNPHWDSGVVSALGSLEA